MAKGKNALDRLKQMSQKELAKKLPCPVEMGIKAAYILNGKCMHNGTPPDENYCLRCWTLKF